MTQSDKGHLTNADLADEIEQHIANYYAPVRPILVGMDRERWQQIIAALRQSSDKVLVRRDVVEFLRGAAPLDGHWFGEKPLALKAFWWREYLAAAEAEGHHE